MRVGGSCIALRLGRPGMTAVPKSDERGAEGAGTGSESDSDEVATRESHR